MNDRGFEKLAALLDGLKVDISPRPTDAVPDVGNVSLGFGPDTIPKPIRVATALARMAGANMLVTVDDHSNLNAGPAFVVDQVLGNSGFVQLRDHGVPTPEGEPPRSSSVDGATSD